MATRVPIDELRDYVGKEVALSDWLVVDQERIQAFADATLDHQWIHIDPERAKATPWGTTIAHGYLTLSLLPHLLGDSGIAPEGVVMAINYGAEKIRFINPVPVGSAVRARAVLADVSEKNPGQWLFKNQVTVEIEGEDKPAMVAETLSLMILG